MIPAARASAAIEILDRILAGQNPEVALTNWGRASRFAGSGDRAAVRDLVFAALRCKRSHAALGGGMTGRGLILGGLRATGTDPAALFTGQGHAPAPLTDADAPRTPAEAEALDCPDWLLPEFAASLGPDHAPVLQAMQARAPVFLRVNLARGSRDAAIAELAEQGITAIPHDLAQSALVITEGARKVQTAPAYLSGLVELQDASSQAVVEMLPLADGQKVLDYCAGGGGKTLAMAARARIAAFAHDADPRRMSDLPARAKRAGARVTLITDLKPPYDGVLTDVPCSGSGSWRRDPAGKWALTPERLSQILELQSEIMDIAANLVRVGGWLGYATCSLLHQENRAQVDAFLSRHYGWRLDRDHRFTPLTGGDGFYAAVLIRQN